MVRMDWNRILSIKIESLTDDEIEDLFPMLIRCDIDDIENVNNLRTLLKLSQEILQHKDNQVESLLLECEELKEKVASARSAPVKNQRTTGELLPPEGIERDDNLQEKDIAENPSYHYMNDQKIKMLLSELEGLEEENDILKRKLGTLKEEMEDATEAMDEMTEELEQLRSKNISYKEEVDYLQNENESLTSQLRDLSTVKTEREKIVDDFNMVIDAKQEDWKKILDEKDAELDRLNKELSELSAQPFSTLMNQSRAEIIHLNEEINEGKKIIVDLEEKLLGAASELNESAALIEKLKNDAKKLNKTDRRREQRDLLKKIQFADERTATLQASLTQAENESILKSEQLCQALGKLKKYEDKDRGLADTIKEARELREKLYSKHEHVKELINVINNLELLNSCREMQILSLREKLRIPEDEEISIDGIALKSQEEGRLRNELIRKNEALERKNFEMKSDMRILRYKFNKIEQRLSQNGDIIINSRETDGPSEKIVEYHGIAEEEIATLRARAELDDFREQIRIVIEENEALRKGMHEILDSIHEQDGKTEVEVRSETLERLLEALDVRHVSGWYHPAMRLQERLNVVQGSNSELRAQLKQMRKELRKKEYVLQKYSLKEKAREEKTNLDDSENEDIDEKESEQCQTVDQNMLANWQRERATLIQENEEFRDIIEKLTNQLEALHGDLKTLASGEDEIQSSFANKSRECLELTLDVMAMKRKCATLQNLLNLESSKSYTIRKESTETENALRTFLADMEKRNKLLSSEICTLRSNLLNSVSLEEHNDLKDKHEEMSIRLRTNYEVQLAVQNIEGPWKPTIVDKIEEENPKNFEMCDISHDKVAKSENFVKQLTEINTELRQQLVDLHKQLSELTRFKKPSNEETSGIKEKYEKQIQSLTIENESLSRKLEICRDEIEMQSTTNSLKIYELDSLRHQILDLHAVSDDKEAIARLGFELNICKANDIELTKRKVQLENEILHLHENVESTNKQLADTRSQLQDYRQACSIRYRCYEDVIDFLRHQYAGSTSLTALQRFEMKLRKIEGDSIRIDRKVKEVEQMREDAKLQKELLTDRLEIVERLKAILEEQIGINDVTNIMQSFSEYSHYTLNDIRLKRQLTQLETEVKSLNEKSLEYKSTIMAMEYEMINIQKIWYKKPEKTSSASGVRSETKVERKTVSTQARVDNQSKEVQSEPFDFGAQIVMSKPPEVMPVRDIESIKSDETLINVLGEQLDQALALASERSAILIKYESRIVEYEVKIKALETTIVEKNAQLPCPFEIQNDRKDNDVTDHEINDNAAFKSTIHSLQKMIDQKEETIERYQNLLKTDRDEHSNAAERFQREIRALREEITRLREDAEKRKEFSSCSIPLISKTIGEPVKDFRPDVDSEERIARMAERSSTLEAELNISKELSERWHRLAEERLQHMDHMRERLDEQHKTELKSYRLESNKWKIEADTLRQQLSEYRMESAKENISLSKELQERDNKIHELTVSCQQLQSEFEMIETLTLSQPIMSQPNSSLKMQEMAQALRRDQANHLQTELDHLKRQIKSQNDKEKTYKDQIVDLKQQLSRCYMAKKAEERRLSNRETQLERKVKALEEDLHKARTQLEREHRMQEVKRVKTAEELALWEKQKKWQQIAERMKRELKDKNDEYKKLSANYEKLRSVVSCMEREKWYLRSKLRSESTNVGTGLVPSINDVQQKNFANLESECQTLRDRIKELTERSESDDNHRKISYQLEQQRKRIAALENLNAGNTFVVDQLERSEAAKAHLEKSNIRLESENFELRIEIEKRKLDTPRLKEKVQHLEKYIDLLKNEKSSKSSPCLSQNNLTERKKSAVELEKTVFILKRIVEKLQVENNRLKENAKTPHRPIKMNETMKIENSSSLRNHYELAQKRVVALETDLQLAEQRILMLENSRKEDDDAGEISMLRKQLEYKSELLNKVKQLLTRAAINEKALRQKIQQIELKQTLSSIPECSMILSSRDR